MKLAAAASSLLGCVTVISVTAFPSYQHSIQSQQVLRSHDTANGVIRQLQKSKLIPDVFDSFDVEFLLNATWSTHDSDSVSAELGNSIRPSLLQSLPSSLILSDPQDAGQSISILGDVTTEQQQLANVVVALTDPDAPSPSKPKNSNFCHWLQYSHIKEKSGRIKVKELVKYMPPSPPRGTGNHRYLIIIMVPESGTREKLHLSKPGSRKRWGFKHKREGLREWMSENHLVPIAANYFLARYEKPHNCTSEGSTLMPATEA